METISFATPGTGETYIPLIPQDIDWKILENGNLREASSEEITKYFELREKIQLDRGKIVYRGETWSRVSKILNLKMEDPAFLSESLEQIYMLGIKSNLFFADGDTEISRFIHQNATDFSTQTFETLLTFIRTILLQPEYHGNAELREAVENFKVKNIEFVNFYTNDRNFPRILKAVEECSDFLKLIYRDYLFYFLHTLEVSRYYVRSTLISTSEDFKIAYKFGGKGQVNGFVYECFLPFPQYRYSTSFHPTSGLTKFFIKNHFPRIEIPAYESEKEYSIRMAMLAHFILAVQSLVKGEVILNPQFAKKLDSKKVSKEGFDINQENFMQYFNRSGYENYGIYFRNNGKWQQVKK